MKATNIETKTAVIVLALQELIRKAEISALKQYKGKIDLNLDLDRLRDRG